MKNKKLLAAGLALVLALSACTNTGDSRGTIDDREEDPTPTQAAENTPTPTEVPEEPPQDTALFEAMSCWDFSFSSGVGGWATELFVDPDGTFHGEYYDYDMGVTGPGYPNGSKYECKFRGTFGSYTEISPYIYRVNIDNIAYESTPGTETTKDDMHYIYTEPYGLRSSGDILVYLPGASMEDIPAGYLSWVDFSHFSATKNGIWDKDYPEDLPMCGIYNETDDCGFSSVCNTEDNMMYLINTEALPGLENLRYDVKNDNTYYIEDMTSDGTVLVKNVCFRPDRDYLTISTTESEEEFADLCFKHLFSSPEDNSTNLFGYSDRDNNIASSHVMVNGYNCVYAVWYEGTNEDTRLNLGIFANAGQRYDRTTGAYTPGFGYAYAISISEDYSLYDYTTLEQYLLSLTFSGKQDKLSSASEKTLGSAGYYNVMVGKNNTVSVKELIKIPVDDKDMLKQYGLDPNPDNYGSDFAFGESEDDYTEYDVSDCPIYFVYGDNVFTQPCDIAGYRKISAGDPDGGVMRVYFDKSGEIVMISDPKLY